MGISFSTTRNLFLLLCEARVAAVVTVRVMVGGWKAMGDVSYGVGRLGERGRKPSGGRAGFERGAFRGFTLVFIIRLENMFNCEGNSTFGLPYDSYN